MKPFVSCVIGNERLNSSCLPGVTRRFFLRWMKQLEEEKPESRDEASRIEKKLDAETRRRLDTQVEDARRGELENFSRHRETERAPRASFLLP